MKTVTYLGPSDRRRIRTKKKTLLLDRGVAVEVSNDLADTIQSRCGDRVEVSDVNESTSKSEGETPRDKGETDAS